MSGQSFFIEPEYKSAFEGLGLTSIDEVFVFEGDRNLAKANLAIHRSRIEFQAGGKTFFLKRYNQPPILAQLKNWIAAKKRVSCGCIEFEAAANLAKSRINVPRMVAWGEEYKFFFEKRSFVIIEKVEGGVSLEKNMRREFIRELAVFIKKFHDTGFRHRDLYFSHIFRDAAGKFCLIDLARVFKPAIFGFRYRVKDIAQLNYSAASGMFSNTDRMRFYKAYSGKLTTQDKNFIRKVIHKTELIARHDQKRRQ